MIFRYRFSLRNRAFGSTIAYAALLTLSVVFLFPLLWVIGLSLKTRLQMFNSTPNLGWTPTLENYIIVLSRADFVSAFVNSLFTCSGAVALSLLLGVPAAYTIARFQFRGSSILLFSLLIMRMLPPIAILIPMFLLLTKLGLANTHLALIFAYTTFCLPMVVWVTRGYFATLPLELEECAWIDGASRFTAFRQIALPLARPGVFAAAILSLLLAWNDFLFAAVLTNSSTRTLPVLLAGYSGSDTGVDWGPMTASAVVVVLPVVLFALAAQRRVVGGISSNPGKW